MSLSQNVVEPFANHLMKINYLMWGYVVSIKVGREGLKIKNRGSCETINSHEFRCHCEPEYSGAICQSCDKDNCLMLGLQ